ncbi:hypothetical protein PVA44_05165 [Entomospira nematocerorum]|uniref:Uncharacterized protein n=1 Tax=Entomospira nematocerorum TaxID=2719987 RepID=A0A968GB76_9SPIO|nr:hypothetical protein [Entomospira nematocera]NIZ46589.1 hypothetical protein [Entomospira nematocera]WDI33613.1 hypothetical protein PVA44_05165 [Entomospira nematocera]
MSRYRRPETEGLNEGFFRHYKPSKNYYSTASDKHSIKAIRKKTTRATFINIAIILVLFLGAQYLLHKQSDKQAMPHSTSNAGSSHILTLSHYAVEAYYSNQTAFIQVNITPTGLLEEVEYPIEVALQWQGSDQPFITYRIVDDTLWQRDIRSFTIRHKEPSLLNARLIISIYEQSHITVLSAIITRKES